ncbi:MAG: CoA pyrophosphatase [Rubrivivax sp.]|nr:CoA pyrophosphatase [Rubrivivax sp.]
MKVPRIVDPKAVPVAGVDAHLPAVAPAALTADALRSRFAGLRGWQPEIPGDGRAFAGREPAHAAVLVPLVQRPQGLHVLLTRRTDHLRDHAGQISFPGGRAEPEDSEPAITALREAEEEVGLPRDRVTVIGHMPVYTTITRYEVTPVVALVQPPFELTLDTFEVAEAFEVPLAFLMDPAHHRRHIVQLEGGARQFLSMPWQGPGGDGVSREYFIWGATAAMLRNLYRFLAG